MAGDRLDAILDEHVSELAKHCVEAESAVISEREMSLPVNEQKWLAATVQHCSEALATRADLECLARTNWSCRTARNVGPVGPTTREE